MVAGWVRSLTEQGRRDLALFRPTCSDADPMRLASSTERLLESPLNVVAASVEQRVAARGWRR
jgi:hypothetical protein